MKNGLIYYDQTFRDLEYLLRSPNRNIPANTILLEYTGKRISKEEAARNLEHKKYRNNRYLLSIDSCTIIDGSSNTNNTNLACYINHSCTPTCEAITIQNKAFIKSLKPIKKGTELTYNYDLESYQWITKCRCKTFMSL